MEVETTLASASPMTPAQQGVFFDLLKKQIPAWILESPQELRAALYESLKSSFRTRSAVFEDLRAFKSPEDFCAPLLAQAMSAKLAEPMQIEGVIFQHVRSTSSLLGLRRKLVLPIERDLLGAACENFELSETLAGNYHERSLIYIPDHITGSTHKVLSILPHEFAQLCRVLDLGKSYQEHLIGLFGNETTVGRLRNKSVAYAKSIFEVERHLAYMRKYIRKEVYDMLASVIECKPAITLGKNTLGYQQLEIFGTKINGPMFIGPVSEHEDNDYRCVVYVPGDPLHPLKEYASFSLFEVELSQRLKSPEFRRFFMRFIKLEDRAEFISNLDKQLSVSITLWSKKYVQVDGSDLDAANNNDIFLAMYRQHAGQLLSDARLLVVPTGDEDEKSRLARFDTYKTIGVDILLFMGSLVPMVGEVMFAVAGIQLLETVYEGIASWAAGDQEHAADYMFDTIENLIVMAVLGSAGKAVSGAFKTVSKSDFVSRLRKVETSRAGVRLWKADPAAYRVRQRLPQGLKEDRQGLVTYRRQQYVRIGTDHFAVAPKPDTDVWRVQPEQLARYSPVLETNGVGAWRHDSELVQDWTLLTLFRRLGYHAEQVSDVQAAQILSAIGVDENQLRRVFVERRAPMATVVDTTRRFRADTAVGQFMRQLTSPATAPAADADLQLFVLTSSVNWPKDVFVSVVDRLGNELRRYGPAAAAHSLKLEQALVDRGAFYPPLLTSLKQPQRMKLLGTGSQDRVTQTAALVDKLASSAGRLRSSLFTRMYLRTDVASEPLAAILTKAFPGLPGAVADELAHNADASEWREMSAGRLPLRLSEEARRYQQVINLNRAYEGLFLDTPHDPNTDLVVLDTLSRLPGWPGDVYIEISEQDGLQGDKAKTGPIDASHKVILKASDARYQAVDANGARLTESSSNNRADYFQTLWRILPAHARKALAVEADETGAVLREKIITLALQRREHVARLVSRQSLRAGYRSPMGLADPRGLPMMEFRQLTPVPELARSAVLLRRARELYPLHSLARIESFLTTLGSDEVLAIRSLEALRQQYITMRNTLEQWTNRQTHYQTAEGARLTVPRRSKALAARAILRAWRKESGAIGQSSGIFDSLAFDAQPLGSLPAIVGDFQHIGTLEMNGVGDSGGLNDFLKNFTGLQSLSLTGNGLTRVPSAISDMPRLTRLDLSDNRIVLTADAAAALAAKDHLRSLNLSFNSGLGGLPTFTLMRNLQHLALRATGISDWPSGLDDHPQLQTLDLRDNRIRALADGIFKIRTALNRGTNINGNPLSDRALEDIARYQRFTGVNLGVLTADYTHPPVVGGPEGSPGAHWVSGVSAEDAPGLRAAWTSLSAYPASRDFFLVVDHMRHSAEDVHLHGQLSARVSSLLRAAEEDDNLRNELFRMARTGRVSADGAEELFSDLEVRVQCYRAIQAARTGERSLEAELVRLMRGLFRLQELQRHVLIEIANRMQIGVISRQRALELSLVYRTRLADRLELPAQPAALTTALDREVTEQQLNTAYAEVVKAENSTALLDSLIAQPFWTQYLRTTHQGQFFNVEERAAQAFHALELQTDLAPAAAGQRMMAIMENFRNENADLYRQLSQQALDRHPGLALPVPAAGHSQNG